MDGRIYRSNKVQKQRANNLENQKRMIAFSEIEHEWQPTLID